METIKFTNKQVTDKDFAIALRKNVNAYFKLNKISTNANAAMVIKTIVLMSIYVVPFVLILTVPMLLWMALILVIIMGIGIAGVGMGVMHDACHGSYSKKPWINNLLSGTIYLLGSNIVNWKIQHNVLHHTYTNISGYDEDIDEKGPIRLSENTPLRWYHKYQFIYAFIFYGMMTITLLFNDFMRLVNYNKKGLLATQNKRLKVELIKMFLRKIAYLIVVIGFPIWFTPFTWIEVIVGFILMHWVASIILSFVFQMAHVVEGAEQPIPEQEIKSNWFIHQFNTTSDFARHNKILGWYVGGLNFQIEHHLFPNICHIHYSKLAPIVEKTAKEFGIKYNLKTSFMQAFSSHINTLKDLGTHKKLSVSH
jgi:linoleoyl-CoA desaturase